MDDDYLLDGLSSREELVKLLESDEMVKFIEAISWVDFNPIEMHREIKTKLAAKQDEGMLDEALTLAIHNGNNLSKLRQKLARNGAELTRNGVQLERLNDIIQTVGLSSSGNDRRAPTLSRLLMCFPVEAFKLAHQIRPKLRRGSRTPEAFPHAMRQNGFGALIPKDMEELREAYCLYKAHSSGKPVNSDNLNETERYVSMAQSGRNVVGESEARELIRQPQYGIFTADGQLVEVLKQMAAEYRTIASVE